MSSTVDREDVTDQLVVEVLLPIDVDPSERAEFEQAMVSFMFGSDRVRPELREDLAGSGVDFNHLALLSRKPDIGVCPSPGATEFIPTQHLVDVCREHGLSLTEGGAVSLVFQYGQSSPGDVLPVRLRLPGGIGRRLGDDPHAAADVVQALFGDCELAEPAQAYLRAHGVDVTEVAARNVDRLGGPDVPFTSRVTPRVHEYLRDHGFDVDQFGRFDVTETLPSPGERAISWEKTTCC